MDTVVRTGFEPVRIAPADVHMCLARHILVDGLPLVYDYRRSQGSYLVDETTGRRYIDLFSFYSSAPLGHNHPKMRDPEFVAKIAEIALINPSNSDVYTVEMAEFVETLAKYVIPPEFPHLFFVAGGAPAVENALKVAFDWKVRKNLARGKGEKGTKVIHFREAFHGRLGYTLSLTNTYDPRKYKYFPKFDWPRVENPKLRFPITAEVIAEVEEAEERSVAQIEAALDRYQDDIAAIIIEPVQCEGGDNHFRPEFFAKLRKIADEREVMLIYDEIQTGMGMTGTWWMAEQLGVMPDIIVFGKKLQVCGIAVSRRVDEVEDNVFVEPSRISSTWGGNLVDMVRGQRYIQVILEDNLLENASRQGKFLLQQLEGLREEGFAISNIRGRGLLVAFDLPDHELRDLVHHEALKAGVILLKCGEKGIRLRPFMDVNSDVLQEAIDILRTILPRSK